jgi:hypothetical protein
MTTREAGTIIALRWVFYVGVIYAAVMTAHCQCLQYGYDAEGKLVSHEIPCSSIPEAPAIQKQPGLFSGRHWSDPPLRNPFASKTFDTVFALYGMASFADAAVTHLRAGRTHKGSIYNTCTEQDIELLSARPTNGQLWAKHGIEFGAVLAFGWLNARYTWLPIAWGSATYGTVQHARGAYSWTDCQ